MEDWEQRIISGLGKRSPEEVEELTNHLSDLQLGKSLEIESMVYHDLLNYYGNHKKRIVQNHRNRYRILNAEMERRMMEKGEKVIPSFRSA